MSTVSDILKEERRRLLELKARYEHELNQLPKGSIAYKRRWKKEYCYRAYRHENRVKFEYLGQPHSDAVKTMTQQIARRKSLESKLKQVKDNLQEVDRGLRGHK